MVQDAATSRATPSGDSEDDKRLRQLENRLDKAEIKCNEAKHIRKSYEVILQKLQEVRAMNAFSPVTVCDISSSVYNTGAS